MINRTKPTLNLPFASMGQENANDAFQNVGGVVTNSNGTRVNEKGLIETVPDNTLRVDYDPVTGECLGILIEESRTNYWADSENEAGTVMSTPYGEFGVFTFNDSYRGIVSPKAGTFDTSFLVKAADGGTISLGNNASGQLYVMINGGSSAGVTDGSLTAVGDGWYLFEMNRGDNGSSVNRIGNADGTDIYVTRIQYEEGSFPTSYIPTNGSAVTRLADNISIEGQDFLDFYNQGEGTFFAEWSSKTLTPDPVIVEAYTAGGGRIILVSDRVYMQDGVILLGYEDTVAVDVNYKSILSFKNGYVGFTINGQAVLTNNTITIPTSNKLIIGDDSTGDNVLNGHLKSLIYYPVALPDTQMIQQTRND